MEVFPNHSSFSAGLHFMSCYVVALAFKSQCCVIFNRSKCRFFSCFNLMQILKNDALNSSTPPLGKKALETDQSPGPQSPQPPKVPPRKFPRRKPSINPAPLIGGDHLRTYDNPISYLGGPKLPSRNRWSIESVLSLD
ncbi:hypothetical protein HUJ04_007994 [Dendroctonus ponderosae]|nr:hypothetical protein HUJ04_007994 [Dendroctonus ponderosae]KAH1026241.1 hypothetical protein HUJ05_010789 [Dendroctonus ponderosae]